MSALHKDVCLYVYAHVCKLGWEQRQAVVLGWMSPCSEKKKKKRTLASLDSLVFGEPKQQQENDVLTHLYRLLEILTFISHFLS